MATGELGWQNLSRPMAGLSTAVSAAGPLPGHESHRRPAAAAAVNGVQQSPNRIGTLRPDDLASR